VGTLNYKAPEIWKPHKDWTGEGVDSWGAGCVVVEIARNWLREVGRNRVGEENIKAFKGRGRMFPGRAREKIEMGQRRWRETRRRGGGVDWGVEGVEWTEEEKLFMERMERVIIRLLEWERGERWTVERVFEEEWWKDCGCD